MSVICETSQSSIWASQQLLLLTHSTTFVFSVALSVNTIASARGVAIARRSGWRIARAAKLLALADHVTTPASTRTTRWLRSSAPSRSPPRSSLCTAAIPAV